MSKKPRDITLVKPDEMISWLMDLNSNWAVLRNTRSFMEGQPTEYWKKFDACMGEAFQLQIALMKLHMGPLANGDSQSPSPATPDSPPNSAAEQPQASERPASKEG